MANAFSRAVRCYYVGEDEEEDEDGIVDDDGEDDDDIDIVGDGEDEDVIDIDIVDDYDYANAFVDASDFASPTTSNSKSHGARRAPEKKAKTDNVRYFNSKNICIRQLFSSK